MRVLLVVLGALAMLSPAPAAANIDVVGADPLPGGARASFEDAAPATPTSPFTVVLRAGATEIAAVVSAIGFTHWLLDCASGDCRIFSWAAGLAFPSGSISVTFTPAVRRVALRMDDCQNATNMTVTVIGSGGNEQATPACQTGSWISISNPPGGAIRELRVWASYGGAFDDLTVEPPPAAPAELRLTASPRAPLIDFVASHLSGGAAGGAILSVLFPAGEVTSLATPLAPGEDVTHSVDAALPTPHCEGAHVVVGVLREGAENDIDDNIVSVAMLPDPERFAAREDCASAGDEDCDGFAGCADRDCADVEDCAIVPQDIADGNLPDPPPPGLPTAFPPPFPLPVEPPPEPCRISVAGELRSFPFYCCQGRPQPESPYYIRFLNDCPPKDPNFKEATPAVGSNGVGWTVAGERIDYVVHYENIGVSDAHDVEIIDVLDRDLDDSTLEIADGGRYDAATRTLTWIDRVVFPMDPREVHFSVRVRADAGPGTHVRNVATIVFPDAFPPTRLDTPAVDHVIPLPGHSRAPRLFVARCTPAGETDRWRVHLANWGLGSAYNASVRAVRAPAGVTIVHGAASGFAHPTDTAPAAMRSVLPFAATISSDVVEIAAGGVDPCPRVAWEIAYQDLEGAAHTVTATLAACTLDSDCGEPGSGVTCVGGACVDGAAADAGVVAAVDAAAPGAADAGVPGGTPDAPATNPGATEGGSGCSCRVDGERGDPPLAWLLLVAAALGVARARRSMRYSPRGGDRETRAGSRIDVSVRRERGEG